MDIYKKVKYKPYLYSLIAKTIKKNLLLNNFKFQKVDLGEYISEYHVLFSRLDFWLIKIEYQILNINNLELVQLNIDSCFSR